MVPGDRPLIAISYNYNARKVLSFIVTDNAGSTKTDIPYLSNYTDQFTNAAIRSVACTFVMSKQIILLMRLNPKTNRESLIWHYRSGGLLSGVGCGYVGQLLWELLLLIFGNYSHSVN